MFPFFLWILQPWSAGGLKNRRFRALKKVPQPFLEKKVAKRLRHPKKGCGTESRKAAKKGNIPLFSVNITALSRPSSWPGQGCNIHFKKGNFLGNIRNGSRFYHREIAGSKVRVLAGDPGGRCWGISKRFWSDLRPEAACRGRTLKRFDHPEIHQLIDHSYLEEHRRHTIFEVTLIS